MNMKTLYPFACHLGLCLVTGTALAASLDTKTPKATTADVPSVQAPAPTLQSSQPKVKLNDDTMNAISEPLSPTSKPPQKTVKPEQVPKSITEPEAPSAGAKAGAPPVGTPDIPKAPEMATMQKPQLDNRQLQQIRQLQESAAAAAALERVEQIRPGEQVGGLPGQEVVDPATGTGLEGKGIGALDMNERLQKADELVHDLLYGPISGMPQGPGVGDREHDPIFSGPGAAGDSLDTSRIGFAGYGGSRGNDWNRTPEGWTLGGTRVNRDGSKSTDWLGTIEHDDGTHSVVRKTETFGGRSVYGGERRTEVTTVDGGYGGIHRRTELYDKSGTLRKVILQHEENPDDDSQEGDTRTEIEYDEDGNATRHRECESGDCTDWIDGPPDDQPDETGRVATTDRCNFNPITGRCTGPARTTPGEMTGQPSPSPAGGGDDAETRTSYPNVGPEAVTNPGVGLSDGRGSGGGYKPPGGTPVNPDPVPPPGGAASDVSIDAAMEGLEAPGAD